ncbi:4'-phosphopantetheinyl transferase superfamily protein [uncultured Corynebacterium sp.]|uniref:4'-phosphopantetheinyl transferase family protein n=1 Tax=uncultured Corynebacterium sp. TaxID=159447 RepID=UPI0025FF686F|nr:4'-phosphopantetheinyl transferase superfamily protein [uncultured Corynebacterium sp.]
MTHDRDIVTGHSLRGETNYSDDSVEEDSRVIPHGFFPDGCAWADLCVHEPAQPSRNVQWPLISSRNWQALLPQERAYVSDAVPLRRAQFADARACARNALLTLTGHDYADTVIGKGERGMPLFPHGIVGSLTHTTGFRAAVVARTDTLKSVGVDAEVAKPLPDGVSDVVLIPRDRQRIAAVRHHGVQHVQHPPRDPQFSPAEKILETVVFSAKEALYKSWFPLARVFLDFAQADIELYHDGTLTAFVHHDAACGTVPRAIPGRWVVSSGYVVTSTWIT